MLNQMRLKCNRQKHNEGKQKQKINRKTEAGKKWKDRHRKENRKTET